MALTSKCSIRYVFEGLAVEPNAGAPNGNGWEGNQNGSLGLNIADNNGHQARIAFGGDFYLTVFNRLMLNG